jgi:uncharacterized protein YbjQ (UPF0145 family)
MWTCEKCGERLGGQFDDCRRCVENDSGLGKAGGIEVSLSTTSALPGRVVTGSLGLVCGEAILGADVFKDFLAGSTDIVGGRAGAYQNKLKTAREIALAAMTMEAEERGANAVVGVTINYTTIQATMMMVTASGTAVTTER